MATSSSPTRVVAHNQLSSIWKALGVNFKSFAVQPPTPTPEPTPEPAEPVATVKSEPVPEPEPEPLPLPLPAPETPHRASCDEFKKLLNILSSSGGSSNTDEMRESVAGSSSGSAALKALRAGWDPFAGAPGPSAKQVKSAAAIAKKKKKKIDKQTGDCVAPVSRASLAMALPTRLGRDDVHKKRDKDGTRIDRTKVHIEVNRNGVQGEAVAQAMRRAQEFADRDKRPAIFLKCVAEYS